MHLKVYATIFVYSDAVYPQPGKGLWVPEGSVTSCHRIIPRVMSGLGKKCRKNPLGLLDQVTNTVQSTVYMLRSMWIIGHSIE